MEVKAGSRVWLEYHGEGAGVSSIPYTDLKTIVIYQRDETGYTVDGKGLARIDNNKAKNVVFHTTPVESDGGLVILSFRDAVASRAP